MHLSQSVGEKNEVVQSCNTFADTTTHSHAYIRFKWRLDKPRFQHPEVNFLEERV